MLRLLKVRRARKAAVAVIAPHVEHSRWRMDGIPETAWQDPYVIGFLAMLITLVAQKEVRQLDGQSLGLVQLDAWGAITRTPTVNIGEDICLLSANGDGDFELGCSNAQRMFQAIERAANAAGEQWQRTPGPAWDDRTGITGQLWARYFDERVRPAGAWTMEPP